MHADVVRLNVLRELVGANSVQSAVLVGQEGGWTVLVRYGRHERALAAKAGGVRVFRTLESAVKLLRGLGLPRVDLDATGWDPDEPPGRRRPDTAAALRSMHSHDKWFREQVNVGLEDLDAGRIVSEKEHDKKVAKHRGALKARVTSGR